MKHLEDLVNDPESIRKYDVMEFTNDEVFYLLSKVPAFCHILDMMELTKEQTFKLKEIFEKHGSELHIFMLETRSLYCDYVGYPATKNPVKGKQNSK